MRMETYGIIFAKFELQTEQFLKEVHQFLKVVDLDGGRTAEVTPADGLCGFKRPFFVPGPNESNFNG